MTTTLSSLQLECPGGLDWAWYGLGECIRSARDKVSIAFGVLSICSWCLFGFPQVWENCRKKMPDTALSNYLLIFWLLGDSLNFIGGFLTGQLFMQKLLAGYTVLIDLILYGQYLYYLFLHKRRSKGLEEEDAEQDDEKNSSSASQPARGKILASVAIGAMAITGICTLPGSTTLGLKEAAAVGGRQLLQNTASTATPDPWADFLSTPGEQTGYAFGWISAVMYVLGRSDQIYKNFKRKNTEGLSFYMFFLAVLGNTFYGLQIFTKSIDAVFVVNSLPWIIGSLGILFFDATILVQFFLYRNNQDQDSLYDFKEDNDSKNDDVEQLETV